MDGFHWVLAIWPGVKAVVQMDADLSHDPAFLPGMLKALDEADMVIGSRYVNGISIVNWPLHRLIVSQLGTMYARLVTGLPVTDCTSGFKAIRTSVLRGLDLEAFRSNGYCFQIEMCFRAWQQGYRLQDYPIIFYDRTAGETKMDLRISLEAIWIVSTLGLRRIMSPGYSVGKCSRPERTTR